MIQSRREEVVLVLALNRPVFEFGLQMLYGQVMRIGNISALSVRLIRLLVRR
jgi:hypothetical protein